MNQLTPYEVLIAEKVTQAAVPDMADSIWASIEQQLAMDPPADDPSSPENPGKTVPKPGPRFYFYLIVAAIVVVAIALILYKSTGKKAPEKIEIPAPIIPPEIIQQPDHPVETKSRIVIPASSGKKANSIDSLSKNILFPDSLLHMPVIVLPDSLGGKKMDLSQPPPLVPAVNEPGKKPKGVKGITDSDYKIVTGNNDSVKR